MTIRDSIQAMAKQGMVNGTCRVAKVLAVSGVTCTVETLDTETELTDVRLQAGSGNGILITPMVDSFVIVAPYNDFEYAVVMFSAIDEIKLLDGSFGGLIKIVDLVDKMNTIENKVNDILSAFNSHVHTGVTTGGGSSGTPAAPITGTLTPTEREEIENEKIIHGNI